MPDIVCFDCSKIYVSKTTRCCKDGSFRCKRCAHLKRNENYSNSEQGHKTKLEYRLRTKKDAIKRAKAWAKNNPKRRKEIEKKYRISYKGKEANRKRDKKRYWSEPEYYRQKALARQHGVTIALIETLFKEQPVCQFCGTKNKLTLDHMHPVSKGGKATKNNIQVLCASCNSWKCDKLFLADGSGYLMGAPYGG